ncbi:Coronin [Caligus rogercresseyi]|uniref:Coronin n=1 Tax=Caligus rogercresseyi TaxID=217165 RepID=A0A7T8K208_CALRO|nr:Coronin [Caligus rogercresseyi]
MAVMEEVNSQISSITSKQKEKIDEQVAEIRKLKAMIVKHDSRISTLETRCRELESAGLRSNNGHCSEMMDPDEV